MITWPVDIKDLPDTYLREALITVAEMDAFREMKLKDPRALKRFKNQPPPAEAVTFTILRNELNAEIDKRGTVFEPVEPIEPKPVEFEPVVEPVIKENG